MADTTGAAKMEAPKLASDQEKQISRSESPAPVDGAPALAEPEPKDVTASVKSPSVELDLSVTDEAPLVIEHERSLVTEHHDLQIAPPHKTVAELLTEQQENDARTEVPDVEILERQQHAEVASPSSTPSVYAHNAQRQGDQAFHGVTTPKVPNERADDVVAPAPADAMHSPDLAFASRQLLQQAAEETVPKMDPEETDMVAQAPLPCFDIAAFPGQVAEEEVIPHQQKDGTLSGERDCPEVTAETANVNSTPQSEESAGILSSHYLNLSQVSATEDENLPETHEEASVISGDEEPLVSNATLQLDKDLFGFDEDEVLPVLAREDSPTALQPSVPPPTPTANLKASVSPRPPPAIIEVKTEQYPDLMSISEPLREDEAKRQIASKAGMSIREYGEKHGRDLLRAAAQKLVRERLLEEEREAQEFVDEYKARQAPQSLTTGHALNESLTEEAEHQDERDASHDLIYDIGNRLEAASNGGGQKRPISKGFKNGIRPIEGTVRSLTGSTPGLTKEVFGESEEEEPTGTDAADYGQPKLLSDVSQRVDYSRPAFKGGSKKHW